MALSRPPFLLRLLRGLAARRCQRWALAAAVALALAATVDGVQLLRVQRWNAAIDAVAASGDGPLRSGAAGAASAADAHGTDRVVTGAAGAATAASAATAATAASADKTANNASDTAFGWADAGAVPEWQFAHAHALAAHGHSDAALQAYGRLAADPALGPAARFNAANLLLGQGQVLRAGAQPGQALALIELAKEGYRELLRADPAHWPARYNLERAQRLVPDPESTDDEPVALPRDAERAATTMRGDSPGLP